MPTITYLTTIQFDFGAVKLLGGETKAVGISRPLVVTDKGVAACGVLDKVLEHLPDAMQVSIFDGTPENPTEAAVLEALVQYRANDSARAELMRSENVSAGSPFRRHKVR